MALTTEETERLTQYRKAVLGEEDLTVEQYRDALVLLRQNRMTAASKGKGKAAPVIDLGSLFAPKEVEG